MLLEGLILAVAGMGTVYLFLMLMVWLMGVTARMVRTLEAKGLVAPAGTAAAKAATAGAAGVDMARIAAVVAIAGRSLGKH